MGLWDGRIYLHHLLPTKTQWSASSPAFSSSPTQPPSRPRSRRERRIDSFQLRLSKRKKKWQRIRSNLTIPLRSSRKRWPRGMCRSAAGRSSRMAGEGCVWGAVFDGMWCWWWNDSFAILVDVRIPLHVNSCVVINCNANLIVSLCVPSENAHSALFHYTSICTMKREFLCCCIWQSWFACVTWCINVHCVFCNTLYLELSAINEMNCTQYIPSPTNNVSRNK